MSALGQRVITRAIASGTMIATAESCTGGMIAAALTSVAGSSAAFDRAFITYSNEAKAEMLGVPLKHTKDPGAVSGLVAQEMVAGALQNSAANLAVAVTGIAGPSGGSAQKPVGLVYIGVQRSNGKANVRECRFAESHNATTRHAIRKATVTTALEMLLAEMP